MRTKQTGFTLIEVLVISPIVILFIGTFISLLVNLTGESLVIRERNVAVHDSQEAIDDMQLNIAQATGFMTTTGTLLSPQGKNDSSTAFTDTNTDGSGNRLPDALILELAATTASPNNSSRSVIYTGAGACDSKNPIYNYYAVYFVAPDPDTADTSDSALYKRTILPAGSACATPWQRGSCSSTAMSSNPTVCKRRDEKLVGGVSDLDINYFSGSASATAATASDISINLVIAKKIAGNDVGYNSTSRASSLNLQPSNSASVPAPATNPPIQVSRNTTDPYRTTIAWTRVGNATGYRAKYSLNGGAVQTVNLSQTGSNPTFNIDAAYRKQTVALTEVKVLTASGEENYSNTLPAIAPIPSWNDCSMPMNGWQNYGGTYNDMGFTKTSTGAVGLKGLVTGGPIGPENTKFVCQLPVGFRPTEHIIVQQPATTGSADTAARVDVFPDGRVNVTITPYGSSGTSNWVSMDGLIFMTASGNPSWTNASYYNSWYYYSYNDGYGQSKFFKDAYGRVWLQGIGTGGAQNAQMLNIPSGMVPDGGMHYPTYSDSAPNGINISNSSNSSLVATRTSYSYIPTQALYYAATGGKYALPLYNGWANYGYGWTTAQCYKGADGIVILQGLVAGGNPAAGGLAHVGGCAGGGNAYMSTGKDAILGGIACCQSPDRAYRIDLVETSRGGGYLYPYGGGASSSWTALDGLHYIAD